MAYVDKSSAWVLDQFLTYVDMNQIGANCEHLADSFDVEHNWNIATVDGTHKTNSIIGSYINTIPILTDSRVMSGLESWLPSAGVYQIVAPSSLSTDRLVFQIYVSGLWYGFSTTDETYPQGIFFCDGSNMRFLNNGVSRTLYYQKF